MNFDSKRLLALNTALAESMLRMSGMARAFRYVRFADVEEG
jgi:hypothetical protein